MEAAGDRIDLVVNNASLLGPSPQPALADYPLDALREVYEANVIAPLALLQLALPRLAEGAAVLDITSDAGVEAYEGWGGYGSSKAALEQLTAILAAEQPGLRVYWVDPGDMRTQMHQDAFPGEDISDRPPPEESVPGLLALIEGVAPQRPLPGERGRPGGTVIAEATDCFAAHELRDVVPVERDDVALLVSRTSDGALTSACFDELGAFLEAGDLLVVNTSATLPAAVHPRGPMGRDGAPPVHSRERNGTGSSSCGPPDRFPAQMPRAGTKIDLPAGGSAELLAPYMGSRRLAIALLSVGMPVERYLARHGRPIRYRHSPDGLGIEAYQTVFARDPGSAEMPSAAPPVQRRLGRALVAGGVQFAPITLHCGVSSLEAGESPYPERYRVPPETARLVNAARQDGA